MFFGKILNSKIKKTAYSFAVLAMYMANFSVIPAEASGENSVQLASAEEVDLGDLEYRARQEALRRMYERKRKEMEGHQETSQSSPDNIDLSKVRNWRNEDSSPNTNLNSNSNSQSQNSPLNSLHSNQKQNKNQTQQTQQQQQQQDTFTSIRNSNENNSERLDVSALNTGGLGSDTLGLSQEDLEYARDKCLSVASNASICNSKEILTQVGVCLKTGYDMDYCGGMINPVTAMEASSGESMCSAKFPSGIPLIGGKQAFSNCGEALLEGAGLLLMFTPLAGFGMLAKLGKGAKYIGGLLGLTDKAVGVAEAGNALRKVGTAKNILACEAEAAEIAELNASKEVLANELRRKGILGESETLTAEKLDSLVNSEKMNKFNSVFNHNKSPLKGSFLRKLDKDYNAEEMKSLVKEISNAEKKMVGNERQIEIAKLKEKVESDISKHIEKRGQLTDKLIRAEEDKMSLISKEKKLQSELSKTTNSERGKELAEELQNVKNKLSNRDTQIEQASQRLQSLEREMSNITEKINGNRISMEIKKLTEEGRASLEASRSKIEYLAERQAMRSNADYQLGKAVSKPASAVGVGLNAPIPNSDSDAKHYNTKAGDETIRRTKKIMYGNHGFQEFEEAQNQNKTARALNKKIKENKEALNDTVSVSEYLTNSNTKIFKK